MDKPNYYAIIPANVRYSGKISASEKVMYSEISALANTHGFTFASNQYFCNLYEKDETTIRRWIRDLQDAGFVKVEVSNNGIQNIRKIWILADEQNAPTWGQKCPGGGGKNAPPTTNNTRYNNTPYSPPEGECKNALFESFWDSYPRKVGKQSCRTWFTKHKVDADMVTAMNKAVAYLKTTPQWQERNGQFIPNPLTFLNQRRWEDETAQPPKRKEERWLD